MRDIARILIALTAAVTIAGASSQTPSNSIAFINAQVITGAGPRAFEAVATGIVVSAGKVQILGRPLNGKYPDGARVIDLTGKFVVPGFIVAHAHVSDVQGLKPRAYTEENTRRQLGVYARYGMTTVFSLGGEQAPAFALRDAQSTTAIDRARIFMAGTVITGATPDEGRANVAKVAALKPDIIKIRIDDNLGAVAKMKPEVYRAVIDEAHKRGLRVAAHIFYLDDAKDVLRAGADMIAHSVRDKDIDDELISLLKKRSIPDRPTLTREISTFVYESTPAFFSDAFFLREADRDVMAQLNEPARQKAMASSATAQRYKAALEQAMKNLKKASDAGVLVVMGTDSGAAPERFQGYYEHLEMELMVKAGMTTAQVLQASTVDAARAIGRDDIGSIATGKWADLVVLDRNPRAGILNTRSISAVYIAGNLIAR